MTTTTDGNGMEEDIRDSLIQSAREVGTKSQHCIIPEMHRTSGGGLKSGLREDHVHVNVSQSAINGNSDGDSVEDRHVNMVVGMKYQNKRSA